MVKLWRVLLFALLLTILAGPSMMTAQSIPLDASHTTARAPVSAPVVGSPAGSYTYFLPIISSLPTIDLTISNTKTMQGTSPDYRPLYIQGRDATVRAYVTVNNGSTVNNITGRMSVFAGANLVGTLNSNSMTAPSADSDMGRTLNFNVPGAWMQPGNSYYIDLDPNNLIPELYKGNNRYPATGTMPFNVSYAQPLDVVIVPVLYLPYGAVNSTQPKTNDLTYLESMPIKVLPIPGVSYTLHPMVGYWPSSYSDNLDDPSGAGWNTLLNQISSTHSSEDPSGNKVYYGVVNTYDAHSGCYSCYTGLGWIGDHVVLPTAVGWSGGPNGNSGASETMTHEMGHNFGREHVLCDGTESYPDPAYPYPGGLIGVWGLDTATGTLYNPGSYADYMSYCTFTWTSDYTFAGIKSFRDAGTYSPVRAVGGPAQALYVSAAILPSGSVKFYPIYQQLATPNPATSGSHTLEVLGAGGAVLASYPFTPSRIADSNGATGFGFFVPVVDGMTGLRVRRGSTILGEKVVSATPATTNFRAQAPTARAQAAGTALNWAPVTHPSQPVVYRLRFSRDGGATWQVLALDLANPQYTVPTGVDLNNTIVEIQASDGIHVATQTLTLGRIQ